MLVQLDILKSKIWLQRGVCLRVQRIHLLDHQEQEFQGGAVLQETGPFGHCCFLTKQSHTSDFVQDISLLETCHELFFIPLFVAKSAIARLGLLFEDHDSWKAFYPITYFIVLNSLVCQVKNIKLLTKSVLQNHEGFSERFGSRQGRTKHTLGLKTTVLLRFLCFS
jgi:hypothetical protein